ncbi:hypothetical protein [Candidatus Amarolinea dominans]|uniref:hypothetical protein n=1 Tax=Candidatus Amarolinea dominans TaxID=3140696 RepID=UPI001D625AB0|nr:hypothetical protein [Anaerolineae bacterium]
MKYYYAGAARVAGSSGGVLYLLTDHLARTALTLTSSGVHQPELRYYPFGAARYNAGNQVTTYRFTGQRWDSGTALYFYQSRLVRPAHRAISGHGYDRFPSRKIRKSEPVQLRRESTSRVIDPSGHAAIVEQVQMMVVAA